MLHLERGDVTLAYDDVGPPRARHTVVLIHGFASNRNENWRRVGWLGALERRGLRAVALDLRGHGESGKPHDPGAYGVEALTGDIVALCDALQLPSAILMGYSLGARLALATALAHPARFDAVILGGIGDRVFDPPPAGHPMAAAMEAGDPETITEPLLRSFRHFADEQGEDRAALAACARGRSDRFDADSFGRLAIPVLVVAGSRDQLAGSPDGLAAKFPQGHGVTLPGCDHFSAIAHALFKAAVFDFLEEQVP